MKILSSALACFIFLILLISSGCLEKKSKVHPRKLIIRASKYLNVKDGNYIERKDIYVEDGIITKILPRSKSVPDGFQLINLGGNVLIPGLIDSHTHLFLFDSTFNDDLQEALQITSLLPENERLSKFRARAKSYLLNGFTSVRDLGNSGQFLDIKFQKEKSKNALVPRIYGSGPGLCVDPCQFSKDSDVKTISREYEIISDQTDLISLMKGHKKNGAQLIKVYADNEPNEKVMPIELLKKVVSAAHQLNLKVSSHAVYEQAISNSIEAGVDSIEHGYEITSSQLTLMKNKGIYLVPTYFNPSVIKFINEKSKSKITSREAEDNRKMLKVVNESGVSFAGGTDLYIDFSLENISIGSHAIRNLLLYKESKVSNLKALQLFTIDSARLIGDSQLGQIKVGAYADFLGLGKDPLVDLEIKKHLNFVMKSGQIVMNKEK